MFRPFQEVERKRLLEGDWDVAEEPLVFRRDTPSNICYLPIGHEYAVTIRKSFVRSVGLLIRRYNIWVYRELYAKHVQRQLADKIMEAEQLDLTPYHIVLDVLLE